MSAGIESILEMAAQLPLEQQRELVDKLKRNINDESKNEVDATDSLSIVERTRGRRSKNLDRETVIKFAEDDDFCGY